ncbi:MAG: zinc ABC transporter substrate-binding protein [Limnohabitans sp.]|nr:zinc ABC transporter substrate-binding protein [Limnohabitans sp.]
MPAPRATASPAAWLRLGWTYCLMLVTASLVVGCDDGGNLPDKTAAGDPRPDRARPLVVCTTPMVGDLVRAVGGEFIDVDVLLVAGVDPHLWSPTRADTLRVLAADAVFLNGLQLEGRAGESFARVEASGRPVVRVAETLAKSELRTDQANGSHFDPHVWMDPVLWAKTAPTVATALAKVSPDHAKDFESRAAQFGTNAAMLDRDIKIELASLPVSQRVLVTAHDAFGYFGRRYDLEVRGVQGVSTESEPSLAAIEALVAEMCERSVPAIFAETTVSNRSVQAIVEGCAARGHEVRLGEPLYSDSLGPAASEGATWMGMLRHNARAIAAGLGGRR